MSTEQHEQLSRPLEERVFPNRNLTVGNELCDAYEHADVERKLFELAFALVTEPSKLWQLRQMLMHLQKQTTLAEDFTTWALGHIDERVMSMALEYAHDAESVLHQRREPG